MPSLRLAFRAMARSPLVSAIVVASLALGIGANTAMFSCLDQILLRGLPVQNPDELVFFYHPGPVQGRISTDDRDMPAFSYPMFRDLQQKQTSFTGIAGMRQFGCSLNYQNQPMPGGMYLVSGNYFTLLGVRPALGRLFTPEDDQALGGHPVAVLQHGYWQRALGGRSDVLNKKIVVNGYPMTIVGVAAGNFQSETLGRVPDIFVPISMKAQLTPNWDGTDNRQDYWVNLVARLKPGVTRQKAAEEINGPYHAMLAEEVHLLKEPSEDFRKRFLNKNIVLRPASEGRGGMRRQAGQPATLLLAITGFVLLIACANAANLLLARAATRRKEIAIRLSVGAGRWALVRQLLAEACVLSVAGGILGLLVAKWVLAALVSVIPPDQVRFLSLSLDGRVLLYSLGLSLLTGALFGLYPALAATRTDVSSALKDQGDMAAKGHGGGFFRSALVSGQMAISLLLLVTAGLFTTSLAALTKVDLGMRTERLITFYMRPELVGYDGKKTLQFFERLEEKLKAIPGVTTVSESMVPFLAGNTWMSSITVEGHRAKDGKDSGSRFSAVGPGFFSTMGIPLRNGREFTAADALGAPKVAVVNESFARHYFDGENPVGRRFGLGSGSDVQFDIEIVGVVKDSRYSEVRQDFQPVHYIPYRQDENTGSLHVYVRTGVDPEAVMPAIGREAALLDPNVPVIGMKTMETQVNESIFLERMVSMFSAGFGLLATLLAAVGLYGVLAYTVSRRTREIGIRLALGAQRRDVHRLVAREVAALVGIGVVVGTAGAVGVGRLVQSILFGITALHPVVYIGAALLLVLIAALAASLPARRAARIDPMRALRWE